MAEMRIIIGTPTDDDPLWDDFTLRQEWLHKNDEPSGYDYDGREDEEA